MSTTKTIRERIMDFQHEQINITKSKDAYGSMLELTWGGKNPISLIDGTERKFIDDNDTVIMRGHCDNGSVRIGFGEVVGKVLPADKL